ncbi:MAG TPA: YqaJ viral recombinase family protein [Luteolibacter sp.]
MEIDEDGGGEVKIYPNLIQGSEEWLRIRKGRITASSADKILTPTGKDSAQRIDYIFELVGECLRPDESPDVGDSIAIDHILPRAVVPELAARFYNLEAVPARKNLKKSAKITKREMDLARKWNAEGLLSEEGLKAVTEAGRSVTIIKENTRKSRSDVVEK